MNNLSRAGLFALAFLAPLSGLSHAGGYKVGQLEVSAPWARASAGRAKTGGAFIASITNHGGSMDRLVGVQSSVAQRTEIHRSMMEDGIMKMRRVQGIDVPAGGSVALKPGGYHVMFMGLRQPFKKGESFPLTLVFEKAGKVDVSVKIQGVRSMGKSGMHGNMMHDGKMKH